jgi:membrane protein
MAKAAHSGARAGFASPTGLKELARDLVAAFEEHKFGTYASALAFRALVALIPLVLLGLGVLHAFALEEVWSNSVAPAIKGHVTPPVYNAIDYSVQRLFSSDATGLIAFAAALLLFDMTWAVNTMIEALNEIHDVADPRPWLRRHLIAALLSAAVIVCVVAAVLALVLGPRPGGALHVLFGIGRWPVAIVLLGLAIGLIVRYGPAEHPQPRWASAGSALIIGSWIVASVAFRWWVASVADFKTATGSLTVFLFLSAYVFTSAAIFLIGVELDELLRKKA